ncbi:tetratricopeptide repeat protein [bacterium]|nr:tetratricopeptide repeat protein [bacterium]
MDNNEDRPGGPPNQQPEESKTPEPSSGFVVSGDLSDAFVPQYLPADATSSYIPPSIPETIVRPGEGKPGGELTVSRWAIRAEGTKTEDEIAGENLSIVGPRFELDRLIGRGGMGEVWEARQLSLGRIVAVKRVRPDKSEGPDDERMRVMSFQQEAVVTAALEHPNIIPVHDLGIDDAGKPLLAMKLVRGRPWSEILKADRESLDLPDFLGKHIPILIDVAEAVAFAHSQGIVHRDLKPSQVMVGDFGEVLLVDWGLALDYRRDDQDEQQEEPILDEFRQLIPSRSSASSPSGTPAYMAPEQTRPRADGIGPWTDVYLLGGTLYYLLAGSPPHRAQTSEVAFLRASIGQIEPPAQRAGTNNLPEELVALAMRALSPRPEHRTPNALAFVEGLKDYLTGAGKRRESQTLVQHVRAALRTGLRDYSSFNEALVDLDRAGTLWPTNPAIAPLRNEGLAAYARAALTMGDLVLAEVQTRRLPDGEDRKRLLQEIAAAQTRAHRRERQRRYALAAIALLMIVVLAAMIMVQRSQADKQLAVERALLAQEKESQANRTAELLERINTLRRDEEELASEIAAVLSVPTEIDPEGNIEADALDEAAIERLLSRRDALRKTRAQLEASPAIGDRLDPEPFPLVLAEANLALERAQTTDEYNAAFDLYEQAHNARSDAPEPLSGMGVAAARAGNLTQATKLLAQATAATSLTKGERHKEYADALAREGEANRMLDETSQEYLDYYRQSLEVLEPQLYEMTQALSDRYHSLGELEKALAVTSQSLELANDLGFSDDIQGAAIMERLGSIYIARGEFARGVESARKALQIMDDAGLQSHKNYGYTELDLASGLMLVGELDEGSDVLDKALADIEANPDVTELEKAMGYFSAANTLLNEGSFDHERPERYIRRSIEGYQKTVGDRHPKTGKAYSLLGSSLSYQGNYEDAEEAFLKALDILEHSYGPDHMFTGIMHNNLSSNYMGREMYREALYHQAQSLRILKLWWKKDNPAIGILYNNIAYVLFHNGQIDDCRLMFVAAIQHICRVLGADHPNVRRMMANYYDDILPQSLNERRTGAAEEALHFGSWILDFDNNRHGFPPDYVESRLLKRYVQMTSATLQLDPPQPDWAKNLVREAIVIATIAEVDPDDHDYRDLMNRVAEFDLSEDAADLIQRTNDLRGVTYPPTRDDLSAEDYPRTLDRLGVAFDLREAAGLDEWEPQDLEPKGEELDQAVQDILDSLIATEPSRDE